MNRTLAWQIMLRYLKGKGTANAVPLLSRISMVAIAVVSCAMIIVLSVFNGMGRMVTTQYKGFYPDMRIIPLKGKFFALPEQQLQRVKKLEGIQLTAPTIEDNVLMHNNGNDNQAVIVKGVTSDYFTVNEISSYIDDGNKSLTTNSVPTAIIGKEILNKTGMRLGEGENIITLNYPNVNMTNPSLDPTSAFTTLHVIPEGTFTVLAEFDSRYILASLPLVQDLFQAPGQYSALEIKLKEGEDVDDVKNQLQEIVGTAYKVQTRYEQNKTLYMVMVMEKWAIYCILLLILVIASFNMIGALSLLVLEKSKDIAILKAMGADKRTIRNIFLGEGILWTVIGGLCGMIPGLLLLLGQQQFSWIKLEGFIMDAYPVEIAFTDVILIIASIILVGLLASWKPAGKAANQEMPSLKS